VCERKDTNTETSSGIDNDKYSLYSMCEREKLDLVKEKKEHMSNILATH